MTENVLEDYKPEQEFFVGIDSDGCVFDSMELKHKECFIPAFIREFNLQGVSRYARQASEFVNLYSRSRGCNRFLGLIEQLDWLRDRPEVEARNIKVPTLTGLINWVEQETKLGNPALESIVEATGDPDLTIALHWSREVNAAIKEMVRGVPPFPLVKECLEKFAGKSDMLVVSATPNEALGKEWDEHGMRKYVRAICGQESGNKKETLAVAKHYKENKSLMLGDAPGDYRAAVANNCLFFPINPNHEEASWAELKAEGIDRFFNGTFVGEYQNGLLAEFNKLLPTIPNWKKMT